MAKVSELQWQNDWQLDYDDVGAAANKFKEGVDALLAVRNACSNEGAGILEHVNCGKILGNAVVGYYNFLKDAHGTAGGCILIVQKAYGAMAVAGQANGDVMPSILDSYNPMEMSGEFKLTNRVNATDIQWIVNEIGSGKATAAIDQAVAAIQAIKTASCIEMPEEAKKVLDDACQALIETCESMKQVRTNLQQSATQINGELAAATGALNQNDSKLNAAVDTETDKANAMRSTTASTKK